MNVDASSDERGRRFSTGLLAGLALGALIARLARSKTGADAHQRVRSRINEFDSGAARAFVSTSVQTSAAKSKSALTAGRSKAAAFARRSPPVGPVATSGENGLESAEQQLSVSEPGAAPGLDAQEAQVPPGRLLNGS